MTIWAGKQMSLWTYSLPRRMASSRPMARGDGPHPLAGEGGSHDAAEGVGGVGHQNDLLPAAFPGELHRVGVSQGPGRLRTALGPAEVHRLQEGAYPDAQGALHVALVHLQDQGDLAGDLLHHPLDLVGEVGVVAAAEADQLDVLQIGAGGSHHRAAQHSGVEVVDHVDAAAA